MYTCQKADEYIEKNRVAGVPPHNSGGLVKRSKWVFHIWRKGTFVLPVPSIQHRVGTDALGTLQFKGFHKMGRASNCAGARLGI